MAVVSLVVSYIISQSQMQTQQDYNKENMQIQFEDEVALLEKNKDINSVPNQLKEWKSAGFAPSVMLNESFQPASFGSAPSGGMPTSANIPSLMSELLNSAEMSNIMEQTKGKRIENEYMPTFKETELSKLHSEIDKIGAEKQYTSEQWQILHATSQFVVARSAAQLDETLAQVDVLQNQANKIKSETENVNYQNDLLQWKKDFRAATGVELNDSNLAMAFSLARNGQLSTVFTDLVNAAKGLIRTTGNEVVDLLTGDDPNMFDWITPGNLAKLARRINPAFRMSDAFIKAVQNLKDSISSK